MRVGKLRCPVPLVLDVGKARPNLFKNLVSGRGIFKSKNVHRIGARLKLSLSQSTKFIVNLVKGNVSNCFTFTMMGESRLYPQLSSPCNLY